MSRFSLNAEWRHAPAEYVGFYELYISGTDILLATVEADAFVVQRVALDSPSQEIVLGWNVEVVLDGRRETLHSESEAKKYAEDRVLALATAMLILETANGD